MRPRERSYITVHPSSLTEAHRAVDRQSPGAFYEGDESGGRYVCSGETVATLEVDKDSGAITVRFVQDLNG